MKRSLFLFTFIIISVTSLMAQLTLSQAGSLNTARWEHQAEILPNGKVLAFGGNNCDLLNHIYYNTCELYNPTSNSWSFTGSMQDKRSSFASVVLNDGKVLAIGGEDQNLNPLASCEVYDPGTGQWTPVANMNEVRSFHKAVKLPDGRVLTTGSYTTKTAEIYDPYTNTWQYTDTVNKIHGEAASLILLDNGKVLLAGGKGAPGFAELYDPATNAWTLLPALKQARSYHNSVKLPNGKILLTGGDASQKGCEIFSPSPNTFATTGSLLINVGDAQTILMDDGNVLIYGIGDVFNGTNTKCLQVYNPGAGTWTAGIYNFIGTNSYTITKLFNGNILIAGGSWTTGNGASASCILVGPSSFAGCVPPNLALTSTGSSTCYGKSPSVSVTGGETGVTYTAYISGIKTSNSVLGAASSTISLFSSIIQPGKNIVTIMAQKAGCPSFFLNDTAIVNAAVIISPPVLSPAGPVYLCSGESVTLSTTSGYPSYLWLNGSTTTVPSRTVLNNLPYAYSYFTNVKFIDGSGCASLPSNTVKVIYNPQVKAGPAISTCDNTPAFQLTGFSPAGGVWSGTGVSAGGVFDPTSVGPGTYTLTYTKCVASSRQVTVNLTSVPAITAKFVKDTICPNQSATLQVINSIAGVVYKLRLGTTQIGSALTGNGGILNFPTGNINTNSTFNILSTLSNSCATQSLVAYYLVYIKPISTLLVNVHDSYICKGGSTSIIIDSSQAGVSYQLKVGTQNVYNPVTGDGDTIAIKVGPLIAATTYTISATSVGCSAVNLTTKATVNIQQPLSFFAPSVMGVQPGEYISFDNNSANPSGTYSWNFGPLASIVSSTKVQPDSIYYLQSGTYKVSLIAMSPLGCKDTLVQSVNVFSYNNQDNCVAARGTFVGYGSGSPLALVNDNNDNTYFFGFMDNTRQVIAFSKYNDTIRQIHPYNPQYDEAHVLIKYNKFGIPLWVVKIRHNSKWTRPGNIDIDTAGNIYFTYFHGEYLDSIRFYSKDNRYYSFDPPHNSNYTSGIVCKYNSKGYFQWVRTFLDYYTVPKTCLRVDPKGYIYVGSERVFCKYDLDGNPLWNKTTVSPMNGGLQAIDVDKSGNVHVLKRNAINIEKFNSLGNLISSSTPPQDLGSLIIESSHLKLDQLGNIYSAGIFQGKLVFATDTFSVNNGPNSQDGFLAAYNVVTGQQKWLIQIKRKAELRIMGLDVKNGVGMLIGHVYGMNETLQIGNKTIYFAKKGYFSFNFDSLGNVSNFMAIHSPSENSYLYPHDLLKYNHLDNNVSMGFDFTDTVQYGTASFRAIINARNYIILKGNMSCLQTSIPTDTRGNFTSKVADSKFELLIYPNPFNKKSLAKLTLNSKASIQIILYNSLGQEMSIIENRYLESGNYTYNIEVENKGIYFLRSIINGVPSSQKLIQVE